MSTAMVMLTAAMLPVLKECGPALRAVLTAWYFCSIHYHGYAATYGGASHVEGVRPRLKRAVCSPYDLGYVGSTSLAVYTTTSDVGRVRPR